MPLKDQKKAGTDHSAGVSELIGAILLITITVMAVSIVGVVLLSQQRPEQIPNINFMTGTNVAGDTLFLYHNGGDTLRTGDFAVVLDGKTMRTDYTVSDGSNNWSVGKNLILSIATPPKTVGLVYTGGSGNVLLRTASSSIASPLEQINPDATPVVPTIAPSGPSYIFNDVANITNSSYFVEALKQNVSSTAINFYKNSVSPNGGLAPGTYLSFTVTDTSGKSQIEHGGVLLRLNNTDRITVSIRSNTQNFKIFGIAPQIWEMAVKGADLTITRTGGVSTITETGVDITHTYISNYTVAGSTLEVDTRGNSVTSLTVNNTRYLPVSASGYSSAEVSFYGVRPLPVGLFLIEIDNSWGTAYVVATANKICIDTNCGPFGL